MIKRCVAVVSLALCSTGAQANGFDISLSDETANVVYLTDSGSLGYGGADVGFGVFWNEADDVVGHANILVTSNPQSGNNFQFGVGAKAFLGEVDGPDEDENVSAVGIGGMVRYVIPSQTPMGVSVEGYWAPDVTSFSDTEGLKEVTARFELEVMPSTRGYVGYRLLEPDLDTAGKVEIDDEFHIGIRFIF
jgi:hypothetical protein